MKLQQSHIENKDVTFENDDLFNRKEIWNSLTNLIENSENESLVISINAQWWEWKTHFLNCWKNDLKQSSKNVIYFDAFENDYIDDPFLPITWEIIKTFSWKEEISKTIKDKSKNIAKGIIPLAVKVGARWIMKWDNDQIDNDLEKLVEWDIASQVEKKFDAYISKDAEIQDFRNTLEQIIKSEWEIIFIIDELDRCRPDFALRLLERIKHFFNIEWLYFVLWMNKPQIEAYIHKIYGNIDTNNYLQKFIDFEIIFPKIEWENNYEKYLNYMFDKEYNHIFSQCNDKELFKTIVIELANNLDVSYRELWKIINYLVIFYKIHPIFPYNRIIIISIFLKVLKIKLYKELREWKNNRSEIQEFININWLSGDLRTGINVEFTLLFSKTLTTEMVRTHSINLLHRTSEEARQYFFQNKLNILDTFKLR